MAILRKRNNNFGKSGQCTDSAVHLEQNCLALAPSGPIRRPIRVEMEIFAMLDAHTIDSDKERQNLSRVTDSTDLYERIYQGTAL